MDVRNFDPKMAAKDVRDSENLKWYDPAEAPFVVSGLNWFKDEKKYQRFREESIPLLNERAPGAAFLSRCPTGGQIAFETNASRIVIAAKLAGINEMDHFASTGVCGVDCYISYPGEKFCFEGVTRFDDRKDYYCCELIEGRSAENKKVILNLPLYIGLEAVSIGLPKDAYVAAPSWKKDEKPIVFYGSSITQGGCASRPGMLYTNILSRWMNREFLNFGFSGSGLGEIEIAEELSEITNPALYVLIYEPNAGVTIKNTLDDFIACLRLKHSDTPILIISRQYVHYEQHIENKKAILDDLRNFQEETVSKLKKQGDKNIYFLDGSILLGEDADECTVDGNHPTDLGFYRIACNLRPVLEKLC